MGEYWLHSTDPEIVVVIEADGFASLLGFTGAWNLYEMPTRSRLPIRSSPSPAAQLGGVPILRLSKRHVRRVEPSETSALGSVSLNVCLALVLYILEA